MRVVFLLAASALVVGAAFAFADVPNASAHRDGCHRWHSCPSDTGSYVCGDLGYYSECPGYLPPTDVPYVPYVPPNPLVALPISSSQTCGASGLVNVTFRWDAVYPALMQQRWLDLSIFNNGFAFGTVLGAG